MERRIATEVKEGFGVNYEMVGKRELKWYILGDREVDASSEVPALIVSTLAAIKVPRSQAQT